MSCSPEQEKQLRDIVSSVCRRYAPAVLAHVDAADPKGCRMVVMGVPHTHILEFPHEVLIAIVENGYRLLSYNSSADEEGGNFEFEIALP